METRPLDSDESRLEYALDHFRRLETVGWERSNAVKQASLYYKVDPKELKRIIEKLDNE